MDVTLKPGTYVVAVSGGVDSMALLHMLKDQPDLKLVVAHFDHGIRPDSHLDRQLVEKTARDYGLPFVYDHGRLGAGASEATARKARYDFLRRAQKATGAKAVVTAHHRDDLLETAIHNLMRGTARRGLTSLANRHGLHRPLLDVPKWQLLDYAAQHDLDWREDTTNQDVRYRRNYIRQQVLPKFEYRHRQELLKHIQRLHELNNEIETLLANQLHVQPARAMLDRHWFVMLPHVVAKEVLAHWLRAHGVNGYDTHTLERLVLGGKTYQPGKIMDVYGPVKLQVHGDKLALVRVER